MVRRIKRNLFQKVMTTNLIAVSLILPTKAQAGEVSSKDVIQTQFVNAEEYGNVFSRTILFTVPGYEDVVRRVSGTGAYRVTKNTQNEAELAGRFVYDGSPVNTGVTTIKDKGRTLCWNQQCSQSTDASGLSFNPILWGVAPNKLHVGQSWTVNILIPWELGPPGQQTITVEAIDKKDGTVRLKREGSGTGNCADEIKRIHLKSPSGTSEGEIEYGKSVWSGYTTFRHGIIISDALLVQRQLKVSMNGKQVDGAERQYVLLNAIDPRPLWD